MPYPGEVLAGLYQVVDEIGKGGAGIIYRAYHLNLHKYVVVKKIKDNFVGALNARGEVDILKSLHHTSLPQVYDFLQIGYDIYTVMDYIDGHDLKYYIDNGYRFDEQTLWTWLGQLVEVLEYLHNHGILHMDIKPANIMLTQEGNICLIDFNISLAGEGEEMNGISETFASPEQYRKWWGILYGTEDRNIVLDAATDIYSLGATFYQMMTGYTPSPVAAKMIPLGQFTLPYSQGLIKIVGKTLQEDKRKRFANVSRMKHEMRQLLRTKEEKNTLKAVFGLMLTAVVVLVVVVGVVLFRSQSYVGKEEIAEIQAMELRLQELCAIGEYQTAYQEGVTFLNVESGNLAKLEGSKQSILEQVVDACIGMKDYESAAYYLEELFAIEAKKEYYQSEAIIFAHKGDFAAAEEALGRAEAAGGSTEDLQRSRAEMKVAQGLYGEALSIYKSLYKGSMDIEILRRMAMLSLQAAKVASASGNSTEYNTYLAEAVTYYEQLANSAMASYGDRMNLATAYSLSGMNEKAITVLQSVSVEYPDKYAVYLQLGILEYNMEMKKAPAGRDFTKVKEYAAKAEELFNKTQTGTEDAQLSNLLYIAAQLP